MTDLTFSGFAVADTSLSHSRITQLVLLEFASGPKLFSVTRYDGVLQQWDLGLNSLTDAQQIDFVGALELGGAGALGYLNTDAGMALLTGGLAEDTLQVIALASDGDIIGQTVLTALPADYTGMQHTTTVTLPDGTQAIYGAIANTSGIARLRFTEAGALTDHAIQQDPNMQTTSQISGTAHVVAGGETYLLTSSGAQNGITSWLVSADGTLTRMTSLAEDGGLWINAPTAIATATIAGTAYAVLAAAGTGSLSVIEVREDGSMIVRDHVLDDLNSRFGGVTSIDIVAQDDKFYVIAGGADDGISVFMLLQGGLLVHRAKIADTVDYTLDNVSAVAGRSNGAGLDIYVASSSEAGLTQLHYHTGAPGVTLTATASGGLLTGSGGRDVLQGHNADDIITAGAGDDILRDGAGVDTLTGGTGRDLFLMSADGQSDTITDFTLGEDQIDLSLWPMLRDSSQLTMSLTGDGMKIVYGDETLFVQSADGNPIDYRDVPSTDLVGLARIPVVLTPGYPGPATPTDPSDGPDPVVNLGGQYDPMASLQQITESNETILRAAFGLPAQARDGAEVNGHNHTETITGSAASDLLFAGDGHDIVHARGGNDTVFGRAGDDALFGGQGADTLSGGAGDDRLEGGFGNDLLRGGTGADTFVFNSGADIIADYRTAEDTIMLDPRLWTGLTNAADLLTIYGETTDDGITITFDTGDTLLIEGASDLAALADDLLLF